MAQKNLSSWGIDISAVHSQKEMNRNRLCDEPGETNKMTGRKLFFDEGGA